MAEEDTLSDLLVAIQEWDGSEGEKVKLNAKNVKSTPSTLKSNKNNTSVTKPMPGKNAKATSGVGNKNVKNVETANPVDTSANSDHNNASNTKTNTSTPQKTSSNSNQSSASNPNINITAPQKKAVQVQSPFNDPSLATPEKISALDHQMLLNLQTQIKTEPLYEGYGISTSTPTQPQVSPSLCVISSVSSCSPSALTSPPSGQAEPITSQPEPVMSSVSVKLEPLEPLHLSEETKTAPNAVSQETPSSSIPSTSGPIQTWEKNLDAVIEAVASGKGRGENKTSVSSRTRTSDKKRPLKGPKCKKNIEDEVDASEIGSLITLVPMLKKLSDTTIAFYTDAHTKKNSSGAPKSKSLLKVDGVAIELDCPEPSLLVESMPSTSGTPKNIVKKVKEPVKKPPATKVTKTTVKKSEPSKALASDKAKENLHPVTSIKKESAVSTVKSIKQEVPEDKSTKDAGSESGVDHMKRAVKEKKGGKIDKSDGKNSPTVTTSKTRKHNEDSTKKANKSKEDNVESSTKVKDGCKSDKGKVSENKDKEREVSNTKDDDKELKNTKKGNTENKDPSSKQDQKTLMEMNIDSYLAEAKQLPISSKKANKLNFTVPKLKEGAKKEIQDQKEEDESSKQPNKATKKTMKVTSSLKVKSEPPDESMSNKAEQSRSRSGSCDTAGSTEGQGEPTEKLKIPSFEELDQSTKLWIVKEKLRQVGALMELCIQGIDKQDLGQIVSIVTLFAADFEIYARGAPDENVTMFISCFELDIVKNILLQLYALCLTKRSLTIGFKHVGVYPAIQITLRVNMPQGLSVFDDTMKNTDLSSHEAAFSGNLNSVPSMCYSYVLLGSQHCKLQQVRKEPQEAAVEKELRFFFSSEDTLNSFLLFYESIRVNGRQLKIVYRGGKRIESHVEINKIPLYQKPTGLSLSTFKEVLSPDSNSNVRYSGIYFPRSVCKLADGLLPVEQQTQEEDLDAYLTTSNESITGGSVQDSNKHGTRQKITMEKEAPLKDKDSVHKNETKSVSAQALNTDLLNEVDSTIMKQESTVSEVMPLPNQDRPPGTVSQGPLPMNQSISCGMNLNTPPLPIMTSGLPGSVLNQSPLAINQGPTETNSNTPPSMVPPPLTSLMPPQGQVSSMLNTIPTLAGPPITMNQGPLPRMNQGPSQMMNQGPSQMMKQGPSQMMKQGPSQMMNQGPSQMMNQGPLQMMNQGPRPMMNQGPPPMMNQGLPQMMNQGPPQMMNQGPRPMINQGPPQMINRPPPPMMNQGPPHMMNRGPPPSMLNQGPPPPMMNTAFPPGPLPSGPPPWMNMSGQPPMMGPRPPNTNSQFPPSSQLLNFTAQDFEQAAWEAKMQIFTESLAVQAEKGSAESFTKGNDFRTKDNLKASSPIDRAKRSLSPRRNQPIRGRSRKSPSPFRARKKSLSPRRNQPFNSGSRNRRTPSPHRPRRPSPHRPRRSHSPNVRSRRSPSPRGRSRKSRSPRGRSRKSRSPKSRSIRSRSPEGSSRRGRSVQSVSSSDGSDYWRRNWSPRHSRGSCSPPTSRTGSWQHRDSERDKFSRLRQSPSSRGRSRSRSSSRSWSPFKHPFHVHRQNTSQESRPVKRSPVRKESTGSKRSNSPSTKPSSSGNKWPPASQEKESNMNQEKSQGQLSQALEMEKTLITIYNTNVPKEMKIDSEKEENKAQDAPSIDKKDSKLTKKKTEKAKVKKKKSTGSLSLETNSSDLVNVDPSSNLVNVDTVKKKKKKEKPLSEQKSSSSNEVTSQENRKDAPQANFDTNSSVKQINTTERENSDKITDDVADATLLAAFKNVLSSDSKKVKKKVDKKEKPSKSHEHSLMSKDIELSVEQNVKVSEQDVEANRSSEKEQQKSKWKSLEFSEEKQVSKNSEAEWTKKRNESLEVPQHQKHTKDDKGSSDKLSKTERRSLTSHIPPKNSGVQIIDASKREPSPTVASVSKPSRSETPWLYDLSKVADISSDKLSKTERRSLTSHIPPKNSGVQIIDASKREPSPTVASISKPSRSETPWLYDLSKVADISSDKLSKTERRSLISHIPPKNSGVQIIDASKRELAPTVASVSKPSRSETPWLYDLSEVADKAPIHSQSPNSQSSKDYLSDLKRPKGSGFLRKTVGAGRSVSPTSALNDRFRNRSRSPDAPPQPARTPEVSDLKLPTKNVVPEHVLSKQAPLVERHSLSSDSYKHHIPRVEKSTSSPPRPTHGRKFLRPDDNNIFDSKEDKNSSKRGDGALERLESDRHSRKRERHSKEREEGTESSRSPEHSSSKRSKFEEVRPAVGVGAREFQSSFIHHLPAGDAPSSSLGNRPTSKELPKNDNSMPTKTPQISSSSFQKKVMEALARKLGMAETSSSDKQMSLVTPPKKPVQKATEPVDQILTMLSQKTKPEEKGSTPKQQTLEAKLPQGRRDKYLERADNNSSKTVAPTSTTTGQVKPKGAEKKIIPPASDDDIIEMIRKLQKEVKRP